jgi:ribosome assembly protein RRB1
MIVVSDEDATYIYDLSIEEDEEEDGKAAEAGDGEIPPQLLFVHCGSQNTKEAHWHPQITSLVMTTALSGYSAFIPSNL